MLTPRRITLHANRLGLLALCAAAALALAGCGSSGPAAGAGRPTIQVVERDFKITSPPHVPAGDVTFRVSNLGPDQHELIIVRLTPGRALPRRADGMSLDEDALQPVTVGSLEPGAPGSVRLLKVHLARGRYELFCNMSGHFMGGMETRLVAG